MAALSYPSTRQTTNRARICRVIVDPVTDLFRDLLRHFVLETDFLTKLNQEKKKLKSINNPVLKDLLDQKVGSFSGGYSQFDFTLVYTLLRNICGIPGHRSGWGKTPDPSDNSLSANIDRIREIRNKCLGHMHEMSMSDGDFSHIWSQIRHVVNELEKQLGISTKYVDAVDFIEMDTMDPEQEKRYVDLINSQQKLMEDIVDTQVQQGMEMQKQKNDLKKKGEELEQHDKRINALETSGNFEEQSILSCTKKVLEEHCSSETYVRTASVQATIDMLRENHIAILTGKSGDGKTTTAYQVLLELSKGKSVHSVEKLMVDTDSVYPRVNPSDAASKKLNTADTQVLSERSNEMSVKQEKHKMASDGLSEFANESGGTQVQKYVPVIITSPDQWNKVIHPDGHFVVLFDDIFGSTNFDAAEFEKWKKMQDVIFSSAKRGNVYLIFGIRSHILEQVKREMKKKSSLSNLDEKYEIDFSSKLTMKFEEKLKLVEAFEKCHKYLARNLTGRMFEFYVRHYGENSVYELSEIEKKEIANTEPYYGFPQTCSMFFKRKEFFQKGSAFFEKPNESLFEEIEQMRKGDTESKMEYCVLSYVFIHGSIHMMNYDMDAMQDICKKMRLDNVKEIDVVDAIDRLKKSKQFIKMAPENKNVHTFTHQTLLETVMVSFGQLAPEIVIKTCSKKNLYELIRTQNCKQNAGEVILTIPCRLYTSLAERMFDEVEDINNEAFSNAAFIDSMFYVTFHPVSFDPEFVKALLQLHKTEKYHQKIIVVLSNIWRTFVCSIMPYNPVLILGMLEEYGPHQNTEHSKMESSDNFGFSVSRGDILECFENFVRKCYADCVSLLVQYICSHSSLHDFLELPIRCLFPDIKHEEKHVSLNIVHYCILNGWENIVDMILKVQTPKNSEHNWTCAHFAAFGGQFSLLKKFIQNSEEEQKTEEGYSVLQAALLGIMYSDHYETHVHKYYIRVKVNDKIDLIKIDFANDEEYKKVLLFLYESRKFQFKEEIAEIVDKFGNNVFHYLIVHENSKVLDLLLQLEKDSVHHRSNTELPTPLHVAVYLGRANFVKALWEVGVRPSPSDMSLTDTFRLGRERSGRTAVCDSTGKVCSEAVNQRLTNVYSEVFHQSTPMFPITKDCKLRVIESMNVDFGHMDDYNKTEEILETLEKNKYVCS